MWYNNVKLQQRSKWICFLLFILDYNFKKDAGWLETEGCPITLADDTRTHEKILQRSGLKASSRKPSFLSNGRKKLLKTLRSLSR